MIIAKQNAVQKSLCRFYIMFSLDILSSAIWARFTSAVVILSSSLLSYKFFLCKIII